MGFQILYLRKRYGNKSDVKNQKEHLVNKTYHKLKSKLNNKKLDGESLGNYKNTIIKG